MEASPMLSFSEVIQDIDSLGLKKCVLLGNGFSIDYDPAIFSYASLAVEARLNGLSVGKNDLFQKLGSSDFEIVVDKLRTSADLLDLHCTDADLADILRKDAVTVQHGLADVLADRHPGHGSLSEDEVSSAKEFLSNFDQIFTLNYDLLLYWIVNHHCKGARTPKSDGFEWPRPEDHDRLIWKSNPSTRQKIFYLHGALHMYLERKRVRKLSHPNNGNIISNIRERIENGQYPLIVTEGTADEKRMRISRSAYLRSALSSFADIEGALVVHRLSISQNDAHIFELIESRDSGISTVYIGLHDSWSSTSAKKIRSHIGELQQNRQDAKGAHLKISYYDSKTAHVWR